MAISSHESDTKFKAMVTQNQFRAIAAKLNLGEIRDHLVAMPASCRNLSAKQSEVIFKILLNGWNSEYCITALPKSIKDSQLFPFVQWLFPQAYYSISKIFDVFGLLTGQIHKNHSQTIKRFSEFIVALPLSSLNYFVEGVKPELIFERLSCSRPASNARFIGTLEDLDGHIGSFLKGTHEIKLEEKAIQKRKEIKRKKLRPDDWRTVAQSVGRTTIIDLLYRKRLKSNYRNIDTYLDPNLDVNQLFKDVAKIVDALNMLVEGCISKKIGADTYSEIISMSPNYIQKIPLSRLDFFN